MFFLHSFSSFAFFPKPIHLYVFLVVLVQASSLQFSYHPSITEASRPYFLYANGSNLAGGALQITPDSKNLPLKNLSGRVVYKDTLKLWRKKGSVIASFNTSFILNIQPESVGVSGEGLAFILTNNRTLPSDSHGQWLGIVNKETNGSSLNGIVAVEFDTLKSYEEEGDRNHVGVDVNSIYSIKQFHLGEIGVDLATGDDVFASIQYDGKSKIMKIYVSMANNSSIHNNSTPLISLPIDLSHHLLQEDVYVGFSASTGNFTELNCLKSWNFTSTDIEIKGNKLHLLWILTALPIIIICGGLTVCYHRRKMRRGNLVVGTRPNIDLEMMLEGQTKGPRRFRLEELKSATENFDEKNKLGEGGSGKVYKGFLKKTNEHVAVKRVSRESRRGEQEFIAEITTIGHLSHKNLVRLIGWCYEMDELLLVYEYMSKGSLDKLIFSNIDQQEVQLSWEKRHGIICGVASALSYLHDGCRPRVFHRDVKSSNVMLDSDYGARLGDFGLARAARHDGQTHHSTTTIAGTPGYVAPEHFLTGRSSAETDVYGFGVFVMVVACARSADSNNTNGDKKIVDWLWDLYGKGRVLESVDRRLNGEFDVEKMERALKLGLACCHPNPNERPSMKVALQVLTGEATLPDPPVERPAFIWQLGESTSIPKIVPASVTLQELFDNEVDQVH